jgi:exo-beta-1,3-glucanase (GH17 family)
MVTPTGWPSAARAVTTATPVANSPSASRRLRVSRKGGYCWFIGSAHEQALKSGDIIFIGST